MTNDKVNKNIQEIAIFFQQSLGNCEKIRFYSYQLEGKDFCIYEAVIKDWNEYKLLLVLNKNSGTIFIYLTDAELNPSCHLLSHLSKSSESSISYYPEKVITTDDNYLRQRGFDGLIFFAPEDLEIFGTLTETVCIAEEEYQALVVMPLKVNEMVMFKESGIEAIVDVLESECRDFFSVSI